MMTPPPASGSGSDKPKHIMTSNAKPKPQNRLSKDATRILEDFFTNTTPRPTKIEYESLHKQVLSLPGQKDIAYDTIKNWFARKRKANGVVGVRQPASSSSNAPKAIPVAPAASTDTQYPWNPAYPSLTPTVLQTLNQTWTAVPWDTIPGDARDALYNHWKNKMYENEGALPEDIGRWLQDREKADAVTPALATSDPQCVPPLRVDTNASQSAFRMPTPSDTASTSTASPALGWRTSPDFVPPVDDVRATYVGTYESGLPTPTSSRAGSIDFARPKSEPATSPAVGFTPLPPIPTIPLPPPASASSVVYSHVSSSFSHVKHLLSGPYTQVDPSQHASPVLSTVSFTPIAPPSTSTFVPPPSRIFSDIACVPPPPLGTLILRSVKREMEEDTLQLASRPSPTNYKEFEALLLPHQEKMFAILRNLEALGQAP